MERSIVITLRETSGGLSIGVKVNGSLDGLFRPAIEDLAQKMLDAAVAAGVVPVREV